MSGGATLFDSAGDRVNATGGSLNTNGPFTLFALVKKSAAGATALFTILASTDESLRWIIDWNGTTSLGFQLLTLNSGAGPNSYSLDNTVGPTSGGYCWLTVSKVAGTSTPLFTKDAVSVNGDTSFASAATNGGLHIGSSADGDWRDEIAVVGYANSVIATATRTALGRKVTDLLGIRDLVEAVDLSELPARSLRGDVTIAASTATPAHTDTPPWPDFWNLGVVLRAAPRVML